MGLGGDKFNLNETKKSLMSYIKKTLKELAMNSAKN